MKTNERFLEEMRYMNVTMQNDNRLGHQWTYCNVTSKKTKGGFEARRKAHNYKLNCVDGVQDALRIADPKIPISWYGAGGKIVWMNDHVQSDTKKYFDIISTGGKTVNQLYKNGKLCDGDILIGYQGMNHTNAYYGGSKSFDSGHAYCSGKGEGAKFKKWIGGITYKNYRVNYIMRLKDRAHYRVQAGAFSDIGKYNEQTELLRKKGFPCTMIWEDNMYKCQVGYYSGKTNADNMVAKLAKSGVAAFVKEV